MTPAEIITPHLLDADRIKPHLRIDNRFDSCGELLADALLRGGPDWCFIGKSGRMGESGFQPAWFTPTWLDLRRDDGQVESVLIDRLGMDAAWYMPTHEQVKVIVNSTANELPLGDPRRGPARLTPYMIPQFHPETGALQWRWHNPPIAQRGVVVPPPPPTPGPRGRIPTYAELGDDPFFRAQIGDPLEADMRQAGPAHGGGPLNAGSSAWFSRATYLLVAAALEAFHRGGSMADVNAPAIVKQVRNEWRAVLREQGATGLPPL